MAGPPATELIVTGPHHGCVRADLVSTFKQAGTVPVLPDTMDEALDIRPVHPIIAHAEVDAVEGLPVL